MSYQLYIDYTSRDSGFKQSTLRDFVFYQSMPMLESIFSYLLLFNV
jgi:hypothetical protein